MDSLKSLLSPLSGSVASSGMLDGAKLIILGGTVETARRVSSSAWSSFVNSFFLTAHFSEEDYREFGRFPRSKFRSNAGFQHTTGCYTGSSKHHARLSDPHRD
jgi:hypothetical protein